MVSDLAPGLLAASPTLLDPQFHESVVLVTNHAPEGSLGFVINRLMGLDIDDVAKELELFDHEQPLPDIQVLSGGPVSPETGWLIYDPKDLVVEDQESTLKVSDHLHITTSREVFAEALSQPKLQRCLLVLGYAGWGEGQLDREMKQGSWIGTDLGENIVFDIALENRWDETLGTLGINPMQLAPFSGFN
jgi:putative transcriptional regulator